MDYLEYESFEALEYAFTLNNTEYKVISLMDGHDPLKDDDGEENTSMLYTKNNTILFRLKDQEKGITHEDVARVFCSASMHSLGIESETTRDLSKKQIRRTMKEASKYIKFVNKTLEV